MQEIYLMRHGQIHNPEKIMYGHLPGFHLSNSGQRQAQKVADLFVKENIKLKSIFTSPLERAQETASFVSMATNAPITLDKRLTEWGYLPWQGRLVKEFDEISGYYNDPMIMNGLEDHEHAAQRVLSLIDELLIDFKKLPSLLVSHRETLACAILKINGEPYSKIHDLNLPMGSVWMIKINNKGGMRAVLKWDINQD